MSIPVVFIHKGDHFYLNYSLNQVKVTNPNNPIYLITDTITDRYDFVNYIDIKKYNRGASEFVGIYKHMSTNSYENEMFCFQRWFVLKEFCEDKNIDNFLYLDSDILVYCNIDTTFSKFNEFDFTTSKQLGPHCCYFPSRQKLSKFCEYIPKLYLGDKLKQKFLNKHKHHLDNNLPGGVCDMTAFYEYQQEPGVKAKDLNKIENGEVFDDNINDADGFEMKNGIKKLELQNGFYYGTLKQGGQKIKFNTLHFQGAGKKFIADFYLGKGLTEIKRKLRMDGILYSNKLFYKVARKLGYKFYV